MKHMRYDPTDYLYASARLRAKETGLFGETGLSLLAKCQSADDASALLAASGVAREDGTPNVDAMLEAWLRAALDAVRESVPDPRLVLYFEYPHDGNNLKILEKCRLRGISPEGRLSPLGSIPPERLRAAFDTGDDRILPPSLAAGWHEARERFAKSGDPCDIDLAIDRAIFAALADAAAPFPPAAALLAKRIDLANLLAFCRLAGGDEVKRALFEEAFLAGGTLPLSLFKAHLEEGCEALAAALTDRTLAALLPLEGHAAREKRADELLACAAAEGARVAFGAEVPIAFLARAELVAKNLRILVAYRTLGRSEDAIKEGLRAYDV